MSCPLFRGQATVLAHVRAKSLEEFGELVRHSGEEYTHVLKGKIVLHTEFYDPVALEVGESIYIDSNMGHAYIAGEGCEEALVLSVCSSAEESLVESLLNLHVEGNAQTSTAAPPRLSARAISKKPVRRSEKPTVRSASKIHK